MYFNKLKVEGNKMLYISQSSKILQNMLHIIKT